MQREKAALPQIVKTKNSRNETVTGHHQHRLPLGGTPFAGHHTPSYQRCACGYLHHANDHSSHWRCGLRDGNSLRQQQPTRQIHADVFHYGAAPHGLHPRFRHHHGRGKALSHGDELPTLPDHQVCCHNWHSRRRRCCHQIHDFLPKHAIARALLYII